jgi:acetyl esterase
VSNTLDITVISIYYRLAHEYKCQTDKNDVYNVVSYVSSHSDKFYVDANNMAIGGANISTVVCMMANGNGNFSFKCETLITRH